MLPPEYMPVSTPVACHLRCERVAQWLAGLGYRPRRFAPTGGAWSGALRSLLMAPGWAILARRERPAVVFTNTALNAPALALIKLALRGAVVAVVDVMGLRSRETSRTTAWPPARAVYRPLWDCLERLMLSRADLVLTINERHAKLLATRSPRARVALLPDGAEAAVADLAPAPRAAVGLPADALVIGFMGSLVCSRLDPIFSAWARLESETAHGHSPLLLAVVGDGPDLERYRRWAREAGWLGKSVVFLGARPREEALRVLGACDIAYSDSWPEAGFPFKVYEYMALGLPIVVEGHPQMTETLSCGRDALFFGSADELAGRIRQLAGDPRLRRRLSAAARASFLAAHTLDHRRHEFEAAVGGAIAAVGS